MCIECVHIMYTHWLNRLFPYRILQKSGVNMLVEENKSRVNISIDPNIHKMFKLMGPIHGQTLSGFVEEKIVEYARENSPDLIMKREIARLDQLKANYSDIHRIYNQIRDYKGNDGKKKETEQEENRISEIHKKMEDMILSRGIENVEKDLIKKDVNFNLIKIKTGCKSNKEAENLFLSEFYKLQDLKTKEKVVEIKKEVIKDEPKSTKTKDDLIESIKASPDIYKGYLSNPNTKWSFFRKEYNLDSDEEVMTVFMDIFQ